MSSPAPERLPPKKHTGSVPLEVLASNEITTLPSVSALPQRSLDPYYILRALLDVLPDLGKRIVAAHLPHIEEKYQGSEYQNARNAVRELASTPNSVSSHEPRWHEFGIIEHTQHVVDNARNKWSQIDNTRGDLAWAVRKLSGIKIDGLSLYELLTISIALHDVGKFQPTIEWDKGENVFRVRHTGHEERGGDIIKKARSENPPTELELLSSLCSSFAVTPRQWSYIEQCVRLHFEFGKLRLEAVAHGGYTVDFVHSDSFKDECARIAAEHKALLPFSDMSVEKGVLFALDSAGKVCFDLQHSLLDTFDSDPSQATTVCNNYLDRMKADPRLVNAFKQYPVNRAVALEYLHQLREATPG